MPLLIRFLPLAGLLAACRNHRPACSPYAARGCFSGNSHAYNSTATQPDTERVLGGG